jgi:hypothetical protein
LDRKFFTGIAAVLLSCVLVVTVAVQVVSNLHVTISPQAPTTSDDVYAMVSFSTGDTKYEVSFGPLIQVGNTFQVNVNLSLFGLPIAGPWYYNHTYIVGRLPERSYWVHVYLYQDTLGLIASTTKSFTVSNATGVGGIVVPVDKLGLLAPYIGLVLIVLVVAGTTAVCVKRFSAHILHVRAF